MPPPDFSPIPALRSAHLMTLTLDVFSEGIISIGDTTRGRRRIAPITGGAFLGNRLSGIVLPGTDWVLIHADGSFSIDVRLTLKTHDEAMIYVTYQGLFKAAPEALARFREGTLLQPHEYYLRTVLKFECGSPSLSWLNTVLAVGTGEQTGKGVIYQVFEIQ